jgi:hypothetical protein
MQEPQEQITKEDEVTPPVVEEQVTPPKEPIVEEPLPGPEKEGTEEAAFEAALEPDRQLNVILPSVIAQVAFRAKPEAEGGKPLTPEEMAQQYVSFTSPILDMVEFHTCLGVIGELSPTVRLIIGVVVLAGGILLVQPPKPKDKGEPVGTT